MNRPVLQKYFSPEMQLLCACARVQPSEADFALQAEQTPQIDPDALLATAIRHRVEPLLLHNLKRHAPGVFPAELLDALGGRVRRNTFKSLRAQQLNLQLARLMAAHNIPFLPLKGVTVAQRYYGSISLRHSNDIDFWVPDDSVDAARKLLLELKAKAAEATDYRELELRGERHRAFLRRQYCEESWYMSDGTHLELHWRLSTNANGLRLAPAELLASRGVLKVADAALPLIAPVPLLLYLCDHGARHGWFRMKWLMDLPQVLESHDWDWEQVLIAAKRANCVSALLLGLRLAHALYGWRIPEPVEQAMAQHRLLDWQVKTVCRKLSGSELAETAPTIRLRVKHLLYRLSLFESAGFMWREMAYFLLSRHDLRAVHLPDRWFAAYYALRPLLIWGEIFKNWRDRRPAWKKAGRNPG